MRWGLTSHGRAHYISHGHYIGHTHIHVRSVFTLTVKLNVFVNNVDRVCEQLVHSAIRSYEGHAELFIYDEYTSQHYVQ